MVAATYGNYKFTGFNAELDAVKKSLSKEERFKLIRENANILMALIDGHTVGITGRIPAGFLNRNEFKEFIELNGGVFDNNPRHYNASTVVIGDKTSPSAKMRAAKAAGAHIIAADEI